MAEIVSGRKSLWMRYIDFTKLLNALRSIKEHDGQLRAKDLGTLGIEMGFFRGDNGKAFSLTTIYHYRKIMEHLNMVNIKNRHYFIDDSDRLITLLNRLGSHKEIINEEKEMLAEIIIRNPDCQTYFFNLFSLESKAFSDAADFRNNASFIVTQAPDHGTMQLINPLTTKSLVLNTNDELQAIFWGVRLWSLDLGITDEIFTYTEGRRIFPILRKGSVGVSQILIKLLDELKFVHLWETLSIPDLTKSLSTRLRISTKEFHNALRELQRTFPQYVDFIPTSTGFITMKASFVLRDPAFLKGYIKDTQGRYVSHIRLSREIVEELKEKYAIKTK
ncbi:MAG: hypothetical protein JXA46_12275 [Dehalococcoidales bacterium]|nr:hypothetical protein [Dehalococcoidales bacterium]